MFGCKLLKSFLIVPREMMCNNQGLHVGNSKVLSVLVFHAIIPAAVILY